MTENEELHLKRLPHLKELWGMTLCSLCKRKDVKKGILEEIHWKLLKGARNE